MLVRPAIIFLLIAAFGCQSFRKNINATSKTSPSLTDSISITLKALNLSEDMSRLSTKNDELNLLIYPIANDSIKPVISSTRKTVYLSDSIQTVIPFTEQVLLVVIEEDHDVPFANISEMVRLNFDSLQNAFDQKDYNKIVDPKKMIRPN